MQVYPFIIFHVQPISQGVTLLFFFTEKKKRVKEVIGRVHLENAEKTINRLALQVEQEKAMKQTLPYRFDINMAAFYKYFPSIYSIFFVAANFFHNFCQPFIYLLLLQSYNTFYITQALMPKYVL